MTKTTKLIFNLVAACVFGDALSYYLTGHPTAFILDFTRDFLRIFHIYLTDFDEDSVISVLIIGITTASLIFSGAVVWILNSVVRRYNQNQA